jgi:hypothetical protein
VNQVFVGYLTAMLSSSIERIEQLPSKQKRLVQRPEDLVMIERTGTRSLRALRKPAIAQRDQAGRPQNNIQVKPVETHKRCHSPKFRQDLRTFENKGTFLMSIHSSNTGNLSTGIQEYTEILGPSYSEPFQSTHELSISLILSHLVIYQWLSMSERLLIRAQPQQVLPRFEGGGEDEDEGEDDYELPCSDCGGTGEGEDGEAEGCGTCSGTGELPVIVEDPPDDEE